MQRQLIATNESCRRMNDDRMTDLVALGIQRLLHDKRALEALLDESCFSLFGLEPKEKCGLPWCGDRLGDTHL